MRKNTENIKQHMNRNFPKLHPYTDHPVVKCEEYVQKLYIDMLCIVAMYENNDTENQNRFIQRIMAGSGLKESINEHVKNALEITTDKFDEFLRMCKENDLCDIFIVDSLIIAGADGMPNTKQSEYIAQMAEYLGLSKEQFKLVMGLALSVICQNASAYLLCKVKMTRKEIERFEDKVMFYLREYDNEQRIKIYNANIKECVQYGEWNWTVLDKIDNKVLLLLDGVIGKIPEWLENSERLEFLKQEHRQFGEVFIIDLDKIGQVYEGESILYHYKYENVSWENCSLRNWLNGTMIDNMFGIEQKKYIVKSKMENTIDEIFLLSSQEVEKYSLLGKNQKNNHFFYWWLRDNDGSKGCAFVVCNSFTGESDLTKLEVFEDESYFMVSPNVYVRPAFWLNIDPSFKGE